MVYGGELPDKASVTREQAENAVRVLLRWIGENPEREGLLDTPSRIIESFAEYFKGYTEDPIAILGTTFRECAHYSDVISLYNIRVESHCEHHMAPIIGKAQIAYLPGTKIVGISKIARVVDVFAKRMQLQERMTSQIAHTIFEALEARGVAVVIYANHHCITARGVHDVSSRMHTQVFLGEFQTDEQLRMQFLSSIKE